jgi:Tfp pilus assembly protein PilF
MRSRAVIGTVAVIIVLALGVAVALPRIERARLEHAASLVEQAEESLSQGDTATAVQNLEDSTAISKDPDALAMLGVAREAEGDLEAAEEAYRSALQADPSRADVMYQIALIEKARGDVAAARETLREAVEAQPDLVAARLLLGDLCVEAGETDEARVHYQHVIDLEPFGVDLQQVKDKLDRL